MATGAVGAVSGVGSGNTNTEPKRENPLFNYCWTVKESVITRINLERLLVQWCSRYCFQLEEGADAGYRHYQGTMHLLKRQRWQQVREWMPEGCHIEKTKCWQAAWDYCQKEDTRVEGPWMLVPGGTPGEKVSFLLVRMKVFQRLIESVVCSVPDDRSIYWYWEDQGNVGKTALCKHLYEKYKVSVSTSGMSERDLFYIVSEEKPKCLIIDLPREEQCKILKLGPVEQVKNGFFGTGKYEGKSYCGPCPHVIIFANRSPMDIEFNSLSRDRWVVTKLEGQMLDFEVSPAVSAPLSVPNIP